MFFHIRQVFYGGNIRLLSDELLPAQIALNALFLRHIFDVHHMNFGAARNGSRQNHAQYSCLYKRSQINPSRGQVTDDFAPT
jgi:hypothetical protein